MLRKTISILIIALVLFSALPTATAEQAGISNYPTISATSSILVDAQSGQILYEKNAHERRSIASITKIMTGIITLERVKLDEVVTINKSASQVGESELSLQAGEKMTVQNLLYGLLLQSANDAGTALAEYISSSVSTFAELMNRKALSIGARDTHFANPHGLYDKNHYSTAYDLAMIARYCLKDKTFAKMVATKDYTIPRPARHLLSTVKNHNQLLWQYPYANGIKTGFIRQAGHCLVSSASKNGVQLIAVVLNSPSADACFKDSKNLLEYGFNEFKLEKVVKRSRPYKQVRLPEIFDKKLSLIASKDLMVQVRKTAGSVKKVIIAKDTKSLPVQKGEKLGKVQVRQFGQTLGEIDLVAAKTVAKPGRIEMVILWVKFILSRIRRH